MFSFKKTGSIDLNSTQSGMGIKYDMNVRLVPENWIDNYNEPGQLEGIFALLNGGNVTPERNVGRTSGWSKFGNIAGSIVGAAAGAFAGGLGAGAGKALAGDNSDPRLKENVLYVGDSPSGLRMYEFDYKAGLGPIGRYRGVMANEIPKGAVISQGFLGEYDMVDYSKVDVAFERIG